MLTFSKEFPPSVDTFIVCGPLWATTKIQDGTQLRVSPLYNGTNLKQSSLAITPISPQEYPRVFHCPF